MVGRVVEYKAGNTKFGVERDLSDVGGSVVVSYISVVPVVFVSVISVASVC